MIFLTKRYMKGEKEMKKMIIVKQHDLKDCGVASLASIIRYYDGYVPMEKIRLDTSTTKDGTSAYNLIVAAQKYGFDAKGILVDTIDNARIILPAIAHLKYKNGLNHFVVVYSITKSKVVLMDPAKGKVVMNKKQFQDIFSNIVLLLYPKNKISCFEKGQNVVTIFIKLLWQEKSIFIRIIIVSVLLMLTSIISGYYFKIGIDLFANNGISNLYIVIVSIFLFIIIFKIIFNYLRLYLQNHLNKNIDVLLLSSFYNHLLNLPSSSFSSRNSGEVITRIKELNGIKEVLSELFVSFLLDSVLMIFVIPLLIIINTKLFVLLIAIVIIYALICLLSSKTIYNKAYQNISYEESYNQYLLQSINAYQSIKNLNITDYINNKLEQVYADYLFDSFKFYSFLNKISGLKFLLDEVSIFLIITFGIKLIMNQELSISNLIAFNTLMIYFLTPIKNLINSIPKYYYLKATFTKINEFISIPIEKLGTNKKIDNTNISVNNLTFSYNNYNLIIKNKTFVIKRNSKVMLKGISGCGKSTFCKILMKDITEYSGVIKIGSDNLKDLSLSSIRNNIIYVSQNENLFSDTLKNNLLLGRDVKEDYFSKICHICLIDKLIDKKALRYETIINPDGHNFSGGEIQRIILARSLLKESQIIILDEALSEVDYKLERIIIKNIKEFFKDKTIIYVTHKKQDDLFDEVIYFNEVKNV